MNNTLAINLTASSVELCPDTRERLVDYVDTKLGRFRAMIRRIDVRLRDVNGPRGGLDKHCTVSVELGNGHSVTARSVDASPEGAAARASHKVRHNVTRILSRERSRNRRPR